MPSGLRRYQQQGHGHFLTFSCFRRLPYLDTPHARDLFEHALEQSRQRHGFLISAYVVMPEHVHLLVSETPKGLLSDAVRSLKLASAKGLPQKPFWQTSYYDFNVISERKWAEKIFYIHRNPVKRKLVA